MTVSTKTMINMILLMMTIDAETVRDIPSYINVCGRKNPNLNQCIADNINNLRSRICKGLTELNLSPLEPLNINKLIISDTDNSKINLINVQLTGFCNYNLNSISVDPDKLNISFDLSFKRINLNGTYDIDVRVLLPIVYKAPVYFTSDNVKGKITALGESTIKQGKKYIYVSELKTNLDIKKIEIQYDLGKNEINQLDQIISSFVGNSQKEFIQTITPMLEEKISNWLILNINNIFKMFSYDKILPDRT